MMNPYLTRYFVYLLFICGLLPGCVRLGQRAPEKVTYILSAERSAASSTATIEKIVQVTPLRISPRFASRRFVYRQGESRYQSDFYHEFLVSPASLAQEEIVRWLSASRLFAAVSSSSGPLPPDYVLQGQIINLYGDFRSKRSSGVLEIAFLLLDHRATDNAILLNRSYCEKILLDDTSTDALVAGWNSALAKILENLERDIADIVTLPATAPPEPAASQTE